MRRYITVLTDYGRIPLFFHARPFIEDRKKRFYITNSLNYVLNKDKNRYLFLIRNPKTTDSLELNRIFNQLREKYDRIFYFDDNASAKIWHPSILKKVDYYFKTKVYQSYEEYLKPDQSIPPYVKYYAEMLGEKIPYNIDQPKIEKEDLDKIRLSWNLGIGYYPMYTFVFRSASVLAHLISPSFANKYLNFLQRFIKYNVKNKKKNLVSAQYSIYDKNYLYAYQRKHITENNSDDLLYTKKENNFSYNKTLQKSNIVLSPFGYGEICFRDFEAVLTRGLLIKPNMSHIKTWPDIYIENKTYVSIKWDLKDYKEIIHYYLNHPMKVKEITNYAHSHFINELKLISNKLEQVIELL